MVANYAVVGYARIKGISEEWAENTGRKGEKQRTWPRMERGVLEGIMSTSGLWKWSYWELNGVATFRV